MKNILIFIILIVIIAVVGVYFFVSRDSGMTVTNFEECLAAGNPAMESYPRQCRHDEITYVEEVEEPVMDKEETPGTISEAIECLPEQRNVDACIEIYQPVCASVNVQCITTPCDPVQETYGNSCQACSNSLVSSYIEGECSIE